ncbi:hypothetical protein SEPL_057 [Salmonella phage SE_PL]|nr:hypothetical protein CPT_Munch_370 [Salmonella phage Munch]EAR2661169.1 hypothetical protein [Salmonella enterica]MCP0435611.1 hypothetical protein [Salmonella enterica subsp. enterica serovar Mbandaka]QCW19068.1 hypothetical protein 7t3_0548 [Salmonella phage 7t3]QIG62670.1 hypothetical protein SEPL_057 [Salmonella phage SE_PL]
MIWIALIVVVSLYFLYFVLRSCAVLQGLYFKTGTKSVVGLIGDYPKTCIGVVIFFVLINIYDYKKHVVSMYDCSVQKTIHKAANSEYSWYNGECNFQDKNGVFINMKRVRGLPEGTADHADDDLQ